MSSESNNTRPTNIRWLVLALASATSFVLYLHRYTWAIIRPQLEKEYGFSNTELEQIFSFFNLTYGLGQIPGGIITDLFGARFFLGSMIGLWSVGLFLFAIVGSFWAFGGIRLIFGASQAVAYPSLNSISSKWFAPSSRTTFQGFIASFSGRMGGAFAPLIMASLLMGYYGYSWRMSLIIMASIGIFLAGAFLILFRNSPDVDKRVNNGERSIIRNGSEKKGMNLWVLTPLVFAAPCFIIFPTNWKAQSFLVVSLLLFLTPSTLAIFRSLVRKNKETENQTEEANQPNEDKPKSKQRILSFSKAIKHSSYRLVVFQQLANAGADVVYLSVLGSVFAAKGITNFELGKLVALPLIGGAIGGYVGGYLNDFAIRALGSRRWARSIMGFLGKAIAAGFLFVAISQESAQGLAWGLFVVKFFSDWSQPTVWGTCTDLGGKNAGTVFSIVNTTGNIGALIVPIVIVGPLLDHFSTFEIINGVSKRITDYHPVFIMVAALYLISAVTWLFIDCTKPIDPEDKPLET